MVDVTAAGIESTPPKEQPHPKEPTAAMKNFTFSVPSATPKSTGSNVPAARNLFATEEDVSIVYESQVTPEQREAALKLQLPPNFYAYLQAPNCPGCPGCESDSEVMFWIELIQIQLIIS